ncbi:hypothetical protein B484DRAFT_398269 [Ochromonadaceae sp. CCMP2298]|nr:hypothetical protein B484DRAFT_398269 [Ochromonadaceae sp. CCMP2298]
MKFSLLLLASASLAAARGLRESASHGMVQDLVSVPEVDKCTTIIVGPKAGLEGPMTTHTADCSDCDFRVNKVPARDWPEGTQRPLYVYHGQYPSVVTKDRGATWHPDNLEGSPEQRAAWGQESTVVGHVPQATGS